MCSTTWYGSARLLIHSPFAASLFQGAAAAAADAAAKQLSATPSSASALEAEVQQLRLALKQRDVLVEQLRGDVAALRVRELPCIVSGYCCNKPCERTCSSCCWHNRVLTIVIVQTRNACSRQVCVAECCNAATRVDFVGVAVLQSVKQESCTPLIQYMQGQVGVVPMDTAGASGAGV